MALLPFSAPSTTTPTAQQPQRQGFLNPNLLQALAGFANGNNVGEQFASVNNVLAGQQQKAEETASVNKTVQMLQQQSPELANAVANGALSPSDAFAMYMRQKQEAAEAARPKYQLQNINGRLVRVDVNNGKLDELGNFSDPNANIPASAKEAKYWSEHPEEYKAYQQQTTDKANLKNQKGTEGNFKTELETMKSYRGEDAVKTYQSTRDAYEKVRAAASLGTKQGDIGLVYGFMKMLDPTSVVREGEFATAANSGNISDTVINIYNSMVTGTGNLTPEQRRKFIEAAAAQYENTVGNLNSVNERYSDLANQYGVPTNRVLEQPKQYKPLDIGAPPVSIDLPDGTQGTIRRTK